MQYFVTHSIHLLIQLDPRINDGGQDISNQIKGDDKETKEYRQPHNNRIISCCNTGYKRTADARD